MTDEVDPNWPPPRPKNAAARPPDQFSNSAATADFAMALTSQESEAAELQREFGLAAKRDHGATRAQVEDGQRSPQAPIVRGPVNRLSPAIQALVCGGFVAVHLVVWLVLYGGAIPRGPALTTALGAFTLAYGLGFAVTLVLVCRERGKLAWALSSAAIAVTADTAFTWSHLPPESVDKPAGAGVVYTLVIVMFVVAWGIARRQHRNWILGLPAALVVAAVCQADIYTNSGPTTASAAWSLFAGAFVIGCLICWTFDLGGRLADREQQLTSVRATVANLRSELAGPVEGAK